MRLLLAILVVFHVVIIAAHLLLPPVFLWTLTTGSPPWADPYRVDGDEPLGLPVDTAGERNAAPGRDAADRRVRGALLPQTAIRQKQPNGRQSIKKGSAVGIVS